MSEQSENNSKTALIIGNRGATEIEFWIEPYGMMYKMPSGAKFNVVMNGTFEDWEIDVKENKILIWGSAEAMTIYYEGKELTF